MNESPWPPPGTPPPPRPRPGPGYRSPVLIARLVVLAMAIGLMTNAAATAAVLDEMVVASEALAEPGSIAPDRLAAIDAQRTALARAVQLIDVIGVGLLAVWARRLYGNLRPLGMRELRFSEGWALGAWFVPVINLFRPKQIVNDIWRAGGPEPQPADAWDGRPVSNLLSWWWFFWVVLWLPTLFLGLEAEEPERVRSIGSFLAWCGVGQMIFSILTIAVVVRTTSRQVGLATGDGEPGSRSVRGSGP